MKRYAPWLVLAGVVGLATAGLFTYVVTTCAGGPTISMRGLGPGVPKDVRREIGRLYSWHPGVRARAAERLDDMGPRAGDAVPFLASMVKDKAHRILFVDLQAEPGDVALLALMGIGPASVDALVDLLHDPDWNTRWSAAFALGAIGDRRARPAMERAMQDVDGRVRSMAARYLGRLNDPDAIPALVKGAWGPDRRIWYASVSGLGFIGDERADAELVRLLKHPDWEVRESAADELADRHAVSAVGPLIESLATTRTEPLDTPGSSETDSKRRNRVRESLADTLRRITGQSFGTEVSKWRAWWAEEQTRRKEQGK